MKQLLCSLFLLLFVSQSLYLAAHTPIDSLPTIEKIEQEEFFNSSEFKNLTGRIIKGASPEDFERLSFDPNRRLTFLFGSDGFEGLKGKNGYEMLK